MWKKTAIVSIGLATACAAVFFLSAKTQSDIAPAKTRETPTDRRVMEREDPETVRILFGGDMMFDRWIRTQARRRGNAFVFDGVRTTLRTHDLVVANLEGPITDRPSRSEMSEIGSRDNYVFTFDPTWAETLAEEGIGPVSLGNNHILNQGDDGVAQTKRCLGDAGVASFGDPTGDGRIFIGNVRDTRIAFVNYNEFAYEGKKNAFADIATARPSADFVILYAHWGTEYEPVRDDVRSLAHAFIDAGCDAVIGSHPHIVQEKEVHKNRTVYYSLGNLVFDQYLREDTRKGLLVSMTIDPISKDMTFRDIPIVLKTDGGTVVEKGDSE